MQVLVEIQVSEAQPRLHAGRRSDQHTNGGSAGQKAKMIRPANAPQAFHVAAGRAVRASSRSLPTAGDGAAAAEFENKASLALVHGNNRKLRALNVAGQRCAVVLHHQRRLPTRRMGAWFPQSAHRRRSCVTARFNCSHNGQDTLQKSAQSPENDISGKSLRGRPATAMSFAI